MEDNDQHIKRCYNLHAQYTVYYALTLENLSSTIDVQHSGLLVACLVGDVTAESLIL